MLSREATAAVGSAFNTLTETVKKHEPTLEDVVREALRPMLKSWLDENLPRVVERMVEAEIERLTLNAPKPERVTGEFKCVRHFADDIGIKGSVHGPENQTV